MDQEPEDQSNSEYTKADADFATVLFLMVIIGIIIFCASI